MLLPSALPRPPQSVEIIDSGAKGSRSRTVDKGREQVYEKWGEQEPPGHGLSLLTRAAPPLPSILPTFYYLWLHWSPFRFLN